MLRSVFLSPFDSNFIAHCLGYSRCLFRSIVGTIKYILLTLALSSLGNIANANMPPPPPVSTAVVTEQPITEWKKYTGRLTAADAVALRPRISGQILKVHFQEGTITQQGDLLFEIDARPLNALLSQAKAQYAQANTQHKQAMRESVRGKDLLQRKVISKEEYESRVAAAATNLAQLEAAKAAMEAAKLNVEFTRITSPVSGRLGLAEITEGNWVQAGQTLLTNVVATDRLYVDFVVDERTFLEHADSWMIDETIVKLGLIDDEGYPRQAILTFIDNQVNPQTGTIQLRATLDNPGDTIRPGFFARALIQGKGPYTGILINERAIGTDQGSQYVLTINKKNIVEYRSVTLGPKINGMRVIRTGLKSGETIVVKGLMRSRPGAQVSPTMVSMQDLQTLDTE